MRAFNRVIKAAIGSLMLATAPLSPAHAQTAELATSAPPAPAAIEAPTNPTALPPINFTDPNEIVVIGQRFKLNTFNWREEEERWRARDENPLVLRSGNAFVDLEEGKIGLCFGRCRGEIAEPRFNSTPSDWNPGLYEQNRIEGIMRDFERDRD